MNTHRGVGLGFRVCPAESQELNEMFAAHLIVIEAKCDVKAPTQPDLLGSGRGRDAMGHCWDGGRCDHPDHAPGNGDTIHLIR